MLAWCKWKRRLETQKATMTGQNRRLLDISRKSMPETRNYNNLRRVLRAAPLPQLAAVMAEARHPSQPWETNVEHWRDFNGHRMQSMQIIPPFNLCLLIIIWIHNRLISLHQLISFLLSFRCPEYHLHLISFCCQLVIEFFSSFLLLLPTTLSFSSLRNIEWISWIFFIFS